VYRDLYRAILLNDFLHILSALELRSLFERISVLVPSGAVEQAYRIGQAVGWESLLAKVAL